MPASAVDVRTLAKGYFDARQRLELATSENRSPEEVFLPLFESLNWLVAVDEQRHLSKMRGLPKDLVGALKGLRFARNSTQHQWGMALRREDVQLEQQIATSSRSGTRGPAVVTAWVWCPAKKLPRPSARYRKKPYRSGRWHYTHRLAGKQARDVLDQLAPYVERLAI
jgi:hypothetical protein